MDLNGLRALGVHVEDEVTILNDKKNIKPEPESVNET
jgi:hypothetical protein